MVDRQKMPVGKISQTGKRGRGKHASKKMEAANESKYSNQEDADIDVDCVRYASGSDEEEDDVEMNMTSESEEESDEEIGTEIGLGQKEEEESDVEVTLDFYDPRDDDVTALTTFLHSWTRRLGNEKLSAEGIAKAICRQSRVGTTVRVDTDDSPVGFISCLNVRRHASLLQPLRKTLITRCKGDETIAKLLTTCFEGKGKYENEKMGLLLSERVVNMPPEVVPKLLEALFCEVEWAVEDEPTEELREEYRFGWYLYISEAYVGNDDNDNDMASAGKNVKKRPRKDTKPCDKERMGFVKIEDEAWLRCATHKIMWPVEGEAMQKGNTGRNVVALIMASKHVNDLRQMVDSLTNVDESDIATTENGGKTNE